MFFSQYYKQQLENLSVGSGKEFVKFKTAQLVYLYFNCMYNLNLCQVLSNFIGVYLIHCFSDNLQSDYY